MRARVRVHTSMWAYACVYPCARMRKCIQYLYVYVQHLNFLPDFMPDYFKESLELSRKRDDSTLIARATKKVGRRGKGDGSDSATGSICEGGGERGNNCKHARRWR